MPSMPRPGEPKEGVWLIDGAGHAEGAEVAAEEYAERVVEFFRRHWNCR